MELCSCHNHLPDLILSPSTIGLLIEEAMFLLCRICDTSTSVGFILFLSVELERKAHGVLFCPLQKCVFVSLKVVRWRTGGGRFAFQYVSCIASFLLWFFMLVWNPCRCIYLCSSWIIVNFLYMIVVMFGYFVLIGKHSVDFSNTVLCQNAFSTIFDAAESIVAVIGLLLSNMIRA